MARVTVGDCGVDDRFALVCLAGQRAKDINSGAPILIDNRKTVDNRKDKYAVVSLREIAAKHVDVDVLQEELIRRLQTRNKIDYAEDENIHVESEDSSVDNELDTELYIDEQDFNNDQGFEDDIDPGEEGKF